ncbi:MAG TPA: efflux RND transporter periplasmic adaptor subunit [Nannocystis exedens]|nr:efflux RND transporter periplasmic adaptor subunit [Nannocystis exedens]
MTSVSPSAAPWTLHLFAGRLARHGFLVFFGLLLAVAAPLLAGTGCQANASSGDDTDEEEDKEEAVPVLPGEVLQGSIAAVITAASTIEAEQQVTIHAESTGRIVALKAEEGDKVKKGEKLARIRFDAQSSALVRATTSLSKAQEDARRAEQLYREGVIGKEEFDLSQNSLALARLDVKDRNREIRNTKIVAPFAGTITERFVAEGAFVSNGAQVLSITDFNSLVARVYVPEKELDRLRIGQSAEIVGKAAKGRRGVGTIDRIAPIVDASTGTVKVTIKLPPELCGPGGFLPGMYAEVVMTTEERENIPLVPKSAVVYDEEQTYLFVVPEGVFGAPLRAKRVRIGVGLQDAERIEVVDGPPPGTKIIVAGQNGLKDGALIVLVDAQGKPIGDVDDKSGAAEGKSQGGVDDKPGAAEE